MSTEQNVSTPGKAIVWDHVTHDYSGYLNGEYVGSFTRYDLAEAELNRLAYEQLKRSGGIWTGKGTAQ